MTEPRLKSGLWVRAQLRMADRVGRAFTVLRKGDEDAGTVILKLLGADGRARLLAQATAPDGGLAWHWPLGAEAMPEAEADAYIARQARFRPRHLGGGGVQDRAGDYRPDGRILAPD